MKAIKTDRGFIRVEHKSYVGRLPMRLIQESSAMGPHEFNVNNPGSSYLWVGENHHLNREEIAEMIERMQYWLNTGRLKEDNP